MAESAGEVSVALLLDDAEFLAGLEAARASLGGFADELAALELAPEVSVAGDWPEAEAGARFAEAGLRAGEGFRSGVAAALAAVEPEVAARAEGLASAVRAAMDGAAAEAALAGAELGRFFSEGVELSAPQAARSSVELASAARDAARGGMTGASAIGRSFAAGLASGIRAGRSGVVSAAASVARAAASAARSALAIHSPSRVTEEFGECFDLGFVRGVEKRAPDVEDSVRAAISVAPPAGATWDAGVERAPVARVRGAAIDYDALAEAMDRRQMVLVMNGRRVAEVQERETARVQAARSRRLALGYGK